MRFTPFINYYLIYYSFTEQNHFSWTYSNYFIYASMVLIKEPSMPATLVLNTLPYGFVVLNSDHHHGIPFTRNGSSLSRFITIINERVRKKDKGVPHEIFHLNHWPCPAALFDRNWQSGLSDVVSARSNHTFSHLP